MESSLHLGRIAGIRVGAHWSVLVILWLLTWLLSSQLLPDAVEGQSAGAYWLAGGIAAVLFLACLLAHELSHALVARRHGVSTEGITLWALGGVAQLREESPSPRAELLIAGAGPATSLAVAAVSFVLSVLLQPVGAPELAIAALSWLALVNTVLAVFNLLPGAPLDGGRVLHAILWWRSGDRLAAVRSSTRAGRFLGYFLIGLGILEFTAGYVTGLWLVFLGWFLVSAATAEGQLGGLQHSLADVTVADVMTPHPQTAPGWVTVQDLLDDYVLPYRHSSFPVRDQVGHVTGLVTLADVKRVDARARATTLVGEIAHPLEDVALASASEPIVDLLARLATERRGGERRVLVVDDAPRPGGRVIGIVSPSDVARALEVGALTHHAG